MKKIISALLSLGLILSLCACGDEKKEDSSAKTTNAASDESGEFPLPEGEHAQYMLSYDWDATDGSGSLSFFSDGKFDYYTKNDNGDTDLKSSGHWTIDEDDELALKFENGEIEYCGTQSDSFYVGEFDATFSNGGTDTDGDSDADSETDTDITVWYGTYIGEEAEIMISESAVDGYLAFAFSAELMTYSGNLKLNETGDVASDDHIDITLNGETLTLDVFDSEIDDYVGEYTKQ
jgi:hypothetical protein